jgi:hypothetical protein
VVEKRLKCKACSTYLSSWGKAASGKKRWYCRSCGASRVFKKKSLSLFPLFTKYVLFGYTYEMISQEHGFSVRYLEKKFHGYLLHEPPLCILSKTTTSKTFLLVDGLWLKKWYVMMVYRRSKDLTILHLSVAGKEAKSCIMQDLEQIKKKGFIFTGIVSDGGRGVVSAIKEVFPHVLHQICMAHMHREATNVLGIYPKDLRIKKLKKLADHMWLIESRKALAWWEKQVHQWMTSNREYLREYRQDTTGKWWYIHKGPRKTLRILKKVPQTSFAFLSQPLMPKTTNEIEATFNHLEKRWLAHRGLKTERWESFMKWFVYFYNLHKLTESNRRKD